MLKPSVAGFFGGVSWLLFASLSHAQCSMDTDCKGDRVCEDGACVAPKSSLAPAAPSTVAPPTTAIAPTAAVPPALVAPVAAPPIAMQRHSVGMMAGGIVMLALVPIALIVALNASSAKGTCNGYGAFGNVSGGGTNCGRYDTPLYGGLIVAAGLTAGGIPLYAIGSKKEPMTTALISPWATPTSGGLALRLDL
jgi:hypothetical protein